MFCFQSDLHDQIFTFDQVLRAVHKNAILGTKLPDDVEIQVPTEIICH